MNKEQLRQKLLAEELDEAVVDEKIDSLTDAQLKEFEDLPYAELKEKIGLEEEKETSDPENDGDDEVIYLDKEFVGALAGEIIPVVQKAVAEALEGVEVAVDGLSDLEVEMKEPDGLTELKETVAALDKKVDAVAEALDYLNTSEEERLKELVDDMPRGAKLRIKRQKQEKPPEDEDEDEEDMPVEKEQAVIQTGDGQKFESMSDLFREPVSK